MDIPHYSKKIALYLRTVDVSQFARNIATSIEPKIRSANIQFRHHFPPDLGTFTIDVEIFRTALINMLENAMEACIEDPSTKSHEIWLNVRGDDTRVLFDILDNGPGVEKDQVDRIFRLFHSSKGKKGTGIGLFVTRKVIRKHGGRITVYTKLGKGTRFQVLMPRIPANKKTREPS